MSPKCWKIIALPLKTFTCLFSCERRGGSLGSNTPLLYLSSLCKKINCLHCQAQLGGSTGSSLFSAKGSQTSAWKIMQSGICQKQGPNPSSKPGGVPPHSRLVGWQGTSLELQHTVLGGGGVPGKLPWHLLLCLGAVASCRGWVCPPPSESWAQIKCSVIYSVATSSEFTFLLELHLQNCSDLQ